MSSADQVAGPPPRTMRSGLLERARTDRSLLLNTGFALAFVVLVVVASATSESFLTESNLTNLLRQMVTTGLLALGMLIVILTGGIDLSVGSIVGFAGIMAAGLVADLPVPVAMALAVVAGAGFGVINGVLVARFRLAPFVVTLAALTTIRGFTYVYSETPISPVEANFLWLGTETLGPIPIAAMIMLAAFAIAWVFLRRTPAGRAIVAIGGNQEAVRLAGISVQRHLLLAYAISGFCAGLAGVILASRVGIAQPSVGVALRAERDRRLRDRRREPRRRTRLCDRDPGRRPVARADRQPAHALRRPELLAAGPQGPDHRPGRAGAKAGGGAMRGERPRRGDRHKEELA
jgi:ribose/xylose/arabinose/galactoside ABC-type transport system permease subunit